MAWLAPAIAQGGATEPEPVLAGKVELVEGNVQFFDSKRNARRPKLDDQIFQGDSIVTGADGEVHLRMEDGGFIAVRPNTRMWIASFRAEGDSLDNMTVGLLEGGFRSITGWIAKFSPRSYVIRTPTATLGVRGTDHEPFHILQGSALGEPGTYDKVNQGGTFLQTKYGRVEVVPGRAAFAHLGRAEKPRVLERVPAHFRPSRHEEKITKRYTEIQQHLPQQREDRQKTLKQRREPPKAKQDQARGEVESKREARREAQEKRREAREQKAQERKSQEQRTREERREQRKGREEHPGKQGKHSD